MYNLAHNKNIPNENYHLVGKDLQESTRIWGNTRILGWKACTFTQSPGRAIRQSVLDPAIPLLGVSPTNMPRYVGSDSIQEYVLYYCFQ